MKFIHDIFNPLCKLLELFISFVFLKIREKILQKMKVFLCVIDNDVIDRAVNGIMMTDGLLTSSPCTRMTA